jgi:hypothetical protein
MNSDVLKAISGIQESAWTPIHYPKAIWDEDEQRVVSDAQVAEVPFTAFTSRRRAGHLDGHLFLRRVEGARAPVLWTRSGGRCRINRCIPHCD